ncbi:MAG: class I adenylate-forming enzyme family protein [Burkholderiales bacterium]
MNPFAGKTYGEAIDDLASRYGDRVALRFRGRTWSFADVRNEIERASRALARLPLDQGDTIALWSTNRPEFLWIWLAAARGGLVAALLNTRLKQDEIAYQLDHSQARAVFVPGAGSYRDFLADLAVLCPRVVAGRTDAVGADLPALRAVVSLDAVPASCPGVIRWSVEPSQGNALPDATDASAPAKIIYTSGTTALPKAVQLTHCVWRKAFDHGSRFDQTQDDRLYLCLPLFTVLANVNGVLTFWSRGSSVVLEERFDAATMLRDLQQEACTATYLLPLMVEQLVGHPDFARADLSKLRTGIVATSDPVILEMAIGRLGMRGMIASYGMTETSSAVTRTFATDPVEVRLHTQGRPLPDIEVRIADPDTNAPLPAGTLGEIQVRAYCITPGYFRNPEATRAARTADGWFKTGDSARLGEDGNLRFERRLGDGYKHKGFLVSSAEVEAVLAKHPDVAACAILGIPDTTCGEVGVAFVVPKPGSVCDQETILGFLRPLVASYKLPWHVFTIGELPRTEGTARVQKYRLKAIALDALAGGVVNTRATAGQQSVTGRP